VVSILSQLGASWSQLAAGAIAAAAIYVAVVAATRVAGLRSFAKMSAFDFAMTVAIGSLIASAAAGQAPLAAVVVDNTPLLLMDGDRILHDNLVAARITLDDLHGKLREANVLSYGQIRAVVFETTGDVSVLHGDRALDEDLLHGVRHR
jgi:uncharacterized membrane protein YcaP (DUF421 family)